MALTDTAVRNAKPGTKPFKLFDGGGLYLLVHSSGGRWWRLKYRHGGKEKLLSLGTYPEVGLKDDRAKRDEARKQLAADIDPGEHRKATKAAEADSLEAVAREWFAKYSPGWSLGHAERTKGHLEREIFPWLGGRPVHDVTAPELLAVLRRIEARGALDVAHRAHQNLGRIFHYVIATGRAERNPAADIRGALPPVQQTHHAAITEPKAVGAMLRAIDGYRGTPEVRAALCAWHRSCSCALASYGRRSDRNQPGNGGVAPPSPRK